MKGILYILIIFFGTIIASLLIWAGIIWALVWALNSLGVYVIGSFVVTFSWKLVIITALIYTILHGIFSTTIQNK